MTDANQVSSWSPPGVEYPAIPPTRLTGNEALEDGAKEVGTVLDFWQWAYSDLVNNTTRGVLAEYLVAKAVGDEQLVRDPWATYDVKHTLGFGIEVKSAAYIQSWPQKNLSNTVFLYPSRRAFDPETLDYTTKPDRHAKVYVFALLAHQDQVTLDPLDVSQWEFYVVPTMWLNERKRSQHSIGLKALSATTKGGPPYPAPVRFHALSDAIQAASEWVPPSD